MNMTPDRSHYMQKNTKGSFYNDSKGNRSNLDEGRRRSSTLREFSQDTETVTTDLRTLDDELRVSFIYDCLQLHH